jgi:hypothetical protein
MNFDSLTTTVLTILGSVFFLILTVRIFFAWAQKKWGEVITEVAGAIFIGWWVLDSTGAKNFITGVVHQVFG